MATTTLNVTKDTFLAQRTSDSLNLGAGKDHHHGVGKMSGFKVQTAVQFESPDWSGLNITKITSAVLKWKVKSAHVAIGSTPRFYLQRITASWSEGTWGGQGSGDPGSETWSVTNATVYGDISSTTTGRIDTGSLGSLSSGDIVTVDITSLFERWAPSSVLKSDGVTPGDGNSNYGLLLNSFDATDSSRSVEFWSSEGDWQPYILLTYTTNSTPSKPSVDLYPEGGSRIAGTAPTYEGDFTDADSGDSCASVRIIVATSATVDGSGMLTTGVVWDSGTVAPTTYSSGRWTKSHGGAALTRGTTYYWVSRVVDNGSPAATSAWSTVRSFTINQLPTATKVSPLANGLAYIHNISSDLSVWTLGGAHAKARFQWTFSDPNGNPQSAYQVRTYAAASGGSPLFDSGKVASTADYADSTVATIMGTAEYWTIEVWDDLDESSGESSRTTFKVRWGQAIYEYAPTGGTSSSQWAFTSSAPVSGTQHGFLFATATGASGAGRSAWVESIGALTPGTYLNVMARLATYTTGTQPVLDSMTFTYVGSGVSPDRWTTQVTNATDWALDKSTRRYGTQSYKCSVSTTSGDRYVYPYRATAGDDVVVVANTAYILSALVKTNGALVGGTLRIAVLASGSLTTYLATGTVGNGGATTDTSSSPEGWQRLTLTFTTGPGVTRVRPMIQYVHGGTTSGDKFWVDATKLEEGSVATAWAPGFIADAVVMDANGIAIDATNGGILRLRSGDGSLVQLGQNGLTLGTDTPLFSTGGTRTVRLGDEAAGGGTTFQIAGGTAAGSGGRITLFGGGSDGDVDIQNVSGSASIAGGLALASDITPTALSATATDYAPTGYLTATSMRLSGNSTASRDITGLAGGLDGRILVLYNVGTGPLVLKHETTSAAANRFSMPGSVDITMPPGGAVPLQYDSTTQRWRPLSKSDIPVDVQAFTVNGTWTKPLAGQTMAEIVCIGAGGGGGSGGQRAAGTAHWGGGGGGGGGVSRAYIPLSALGATETVVVGVGGTGGAAVNTSSVNGNAGAAGGDSYFGTGRKVEADGGGGGGGGTTGTGASTNLSGSSGDGEQNGSVGGESDNSAAAGSGGSSSAGAGGGGGGGGISAADNARAGGSGGKPGTRPSMTAPGGGTGGGTGGGASTAGDSATAEIGYTAGSGGGGGGASTAGGSATRDGGNGATYGGGGGGGGASKNGFASGKGGDGGGGLVLVISY